MMADPLNHDVILSKVQDTINAEIKTGLTLSRENHALAENFKERHGSILKELNTIGHFTRKVAMLIQDEKHKLLGSMASCIPLPPYDDAKRTYIDSPSTALRSALGNYRVIWRRWSRIPSLQVCEIPTFGCFLAEYSRVHAVHARSFELISIFSRNTSRTDYKENAEADRGGSSEGR